MSQDITLHGQHNLPSRPEDLWGQPQTSLGAYQPQNGQPQPLKKLHRLLRGRWLLAICLSIAGAIAGAYAGWQSQTPLYAGLGTIEVKPFVPSFQVMEKAMPYFDKFLKNQTYVITDGRTISAAMTRPEWTGTGGKKPNSDSIAGFQAALTANLVKDSSIIQIIYKHPEPKRAAAGALAVMKAYNDIANNSSAIAMKTKIDGAQAMRDKAFNNMRLNEDHIADLSQAYGTPETLAENLKMKNEQKTKAEIELQQTAFMRELAEISLPSADGKNKGTTAKFTAEQYALVDPLMADLLKVQREKADKVNELKRRNILDAHPAMQNAMSDMTYATDKVQARLDTLRKDTTLLPPLLGTNGNNANSAVAITPQNVELLKLREQAIQKLIATQDADLKKLGDIQRKITQYQNDAKRDKDDVNKYDGQMETLLASATIQGTILLGGDPVTPFAPADDKRKQIALMGLVLGGGIPFGIMLLIGLLDSRYRYSDDTSDSGVHGLTLLGILPNLPDRLSDPGQASIAAHCVHQIRTMLQINNHEDRRAFSVTSASSGDGKTSLTLALGLSFAASGSRTLLIDSDLVGAGLTARLGMNGPEGVLEAMTSGNLLEYIKQTDVADLSILPVGLAQLHHAGIFSPQAVRRLVNEAKKHFEIILIDTGPILGSIEATPVAAASDGVILTVARGQQRPLVEKALAHLNSIGARIAGVVFNRAMSRDFEQSISGISMRSASRSANGNGASRAGQTKDAGQYGPVARAVANATVGKSSETKN